MAKKRPSFSVLFTEGALGDLRHFRKVEQNVILAAVGQQLPVDALTTNRNRKPLRPNDLASWELRVGPFRVFYDVDEGAGPVTVKAVGRKVHNKLFIRGVEYEL